MNIKTLLCKEHKTLKTNPWGGANNLKKLPKKLMASVVAMFVVLMSMPLVTWADIIDSGNCGDPNNVGGEASVQWSLDDSGTLTISGNGAMNNWVLNGATWYNYGSLIKEVIIEDGVTSIGEFAFEDFSSITSMTIPNSVTTIGKSAFRRCTSLNSITIPNSVTTIGGGAFYCCYNLKKVNSEKEGECIIPDSITNLGDAVFNECRGLSSVILSNSITSIPFGTFYDCLSMTSITIPGKITSIRNSAFGSCNALTSIKIPCDFDKGIFEHGSDIEPEYKDGKYTDRFKYYENDDYNGTFTYMHKYDYKKKNDTYHICTCKSKDCCKKSDSGEYEEDEKHTWNEAWDNDENNHWHKCAKCDARNAEAEHTGGTATCKGGARCDVCEAEYGDPLEHEWKVVEGSIGDTTATYKCEVCGETKEDDITFADGEVDFYGQKLKCILQDPYKILPDDTEVRVTLVEKGTARYNELLAQLDDTHRVENVAFFEVELYDGEGQKIEQMPLRNKVRLLLQIPDGWDKEDLEAVLVMAGADVEFEESIITIDGVDYLAFWTDHFSPYALIDKLKDEKSEAAETSEQQSSSVSVATQTGESNIDLYIAFGFVLISAAAMVFMFFDKRRKIN